MTVEQQPEPRRSRPHFPCGYGVSTDPDGMLPWEWADRRLARAEHYWICTTRTDGRPHARPIWGAWVDHCFFFDGGGSWRRDIAANPAITVHLESGAEAVIVEGTVEVVETLDADVARRVVESYAARYPYRPETVAGMYVVRPQVVFAWRDFAKDATRFHFD